MTQGHRAAVYVDAIHVRLVYATPCRHHGRERLVDLEQVDVVDRHPVALKDLGGGRDRAFEHLHRVAAHGRLIDDPGPRPQA